MAAYTTEFQSRLDILQASWQTAKTSADSLGIVKADNETWADKALPIAEAEFNRDGKPIYIIPETPTTAATPPATATVVAVPTTSATMPDPPAPVAQEYVVQGVYATDYFKKIGTPYCDRCGAAFQNDGPEPICVEGFPTGICPRLV